MGTLQKSHFQQTVCLADWWLVEAENGIQGRGLAVAGHTSREKQALRIFSSAPILRRYDVFTVETTDGICVTLNGFINKVRTLENGFPSDVCDTFLFGFPPYWKEYHEKFMGKKSSSKDISVNLLEKLSPQSGSGQMHMESHEKDLGSPGKMSGKAICESKETKSSNVPLHQACGSVIGGCEDNMNVPWIASEGLEKESYSGACNGEDHTTQELPVNCSNNKIKSLSDSSCGGSISVSAVIDKDVVYTQIFDSKGYNGKRRRATDNLKNVESDKNNSTKANFDRDMNLLECILSRNEVGVKTRLMCSLKMRVNNHQTSAKISGGEEIRLNSFSSTAPEKVESVFADRELGSGNNWNFKVSGFHRHTNEIQLRLLDAGSVMREFDQVPKTPNQDRGTRKIKTKSNIQKAKNKATKSLHTPAAADNQTDKAIAGKNSSSQKVKAFDVEARRKLAYASKETPDNKKEIVPSVSPQSLSFNRSRSGRLLMPTLEFWCNQRAIYDADRTITGIEGIHEQPRIGSGSTPQRKSRKRTKR